MRTSQTRHEDTQVVVDLGRRADGRAGRATQVLLFDGNRGGESFDMFQVRLLHLADKLPRIGAEAFDVTTLPLGVDGVHGQRRFTAATGSAKDGHLIPWHHGIDILEVMLPGTADDNVSGLWATLRLRLCRAPVPRQVSSSMPKARASPRPVCDEGMPATVQEYLRR